jgi:beta-ribofuranosylaminobenzene 5'-phosphate synthase
MTREEHPRTWGYRIEVPARFSFTLIDMTGDVGRRYGMASLAIANPSLVVTGRPHAGWAVSTDEASAGYREDLERYLERLADAWGVRRGARIAVERGLPAHQGFGSKTATLLAAGKVYAALCGRDEPTTSLVTLAGRAGTSGGTVNLLDRGGFVVDAGHRNPPGFAEDPSEHFRPSRYAPVAGRPPALVTLPFPPWPFLIVLPRGGGLHGESELAWFRQHFPAPVEHSSRAAHVVLVGLAGAIADQDYEGFCAALNEITCRGWVKNLQIGTHPESVRRLLEAAAGRSHVDAIAMSSMGPVCCLFTRDPQETVAWLERERTAGHVESYWPSHAQNHAPELRPELVGEAA